MSVAQIDTVKGCKPRENDIVVVNDIVKPGGRYPGKVRKFSNSETRDS